MSHAPRMRARVAATAAATMVPLPAERSSAEVCRKAPPGQRTREAQWQIHTQRLRNAALDTRRASTPRSRPLPAALLPPAPPCALDGAARWTVPANFHVQRALPAACTKSDGVTTRAFPSPSFPPSFPAAASRASSKNEISLSSSGGTSRGIGVEGVRGGGRGGSSGGEGKGGGGRGDGGFFAAAAAAAAALSSSFSSSPAGIAFGVGGRGDGDRCCCLCCCCWSKTSS